MAQILLILIISSISIIWESLQWLQLIISNAWIYGKSNNKIIYGGKIFILQWLRSYGS